MNIVTYQLIGMLPQPIIIISMFARIRKGFRLSHKLTILLTCRTGRLSWARSPGWGQHWGWRCPPSRHCHCSLPSWGGCWYCCVCIYRCSVIVSVHNRQCDMYTTVQYSTVQVTSPPGVVHSTMGKEGWIEEGKQTLWPRCWDGQW